MTDIGWIGGKLGLPCALVLADAGHRLTGYDVSEESPARSWNVSSRPRESTVLKLCSAETRSAWQTACMTWWRLPTWCSWPSKHPMPPAYCSEQPMPMESHDFEYAYLTKAVRDVARAAAQQCKTVTVAIVSTVLPGTFNRYLRPLVNWTIRMPWQTATIPTKPSSSDGPVKPAQMRPPLLYCSCANLPSARDDASPALASSTSPSMRGAYLPYISNIVAELRHWFLALTSFENRTVPPSAG
jgi:hypothetical protein